MPRAWSGAKTNISSISTPVNAESNQSVRSSRKRRRSLMGSRIIISLWPNFLLGDLVTTNAQANSVGLVDLDQRGVFDVGRDRGAAANRLVQMSACDRFCPSC